MSAKYSVDTGIFIIFCFLSWFLFKFSDAEVFFISEKKVWTVFLGSFGYKMANLLSMSKVTTKNEKNVSTEIVASIVENEFGSEEVSVENACRNFG